MSAFFFSFLLFVEDVENLSIVLVEKNVFSVKKELIT